MKFQLGDRVIKVKSKNTHPQIPVGSIGTVQPPRSRNLYKPFSIAWDNYIPYDYYENQSDLFELLGDVIE